MGVHLAGGTIRCVRTSPVGVLVAAVLMMSGCAVEGERAAVGARLTASRRVALQADDGSPTPLLLDSGRDGALLRLGKLAVRLPASADHVLAFAPVPDGVARQLSDDTQSVIELTGSRQDSQFIPDSLEVSDETVKLRDVGMRADLYAPILAELTPQTYGSEERAAVELRAEPARLQLRCAPGLHAAGLSLLGNLAGSTPARGGGLRLHVRGTGQFALGLSDAARTEEQSPLPFATITAKDDWQRVELPLPTTGWDVERWRSVNVACPETGGELEIDDLELILADALRASPKRALWVWDPAAWQSHAAQLISHLQAVGAQDVFVTVPLSDEACPAAQCAVAQPDALRQFLAQAARAGLQVWAVMGDPAAVYDEEHAVWLARARAFAEFNRLSTDDQRLAGVQFDIEHYLVPGFGMSPAAWNRRYLALFADIRRVAPALLIDAVVPWWFGQGHASPPEVLEELAHSIDRLTVMDYRTDPQQLLAAARPFMVWGQRNRRSIRVALEAGPLGEMELHRYEAQASGELLLVPVGRMLVYVLFDHAVTDSAGHTFRERSAHRIPASRTTFHDREEALWRAVATLEAQFAATQNFAGVAVHGLDKQWY